MVSSWDNQRRCTFDILGGGFPTPTDAAFTCACNTVGYFTAVQQAVNADYVYLTGPRVG